MNYYRSFSRVLKETFGVPVHKITLDAGFTCPNRDGKLALGGCTYCDVDGSGPGQTRALLSIRQQLEEGKVLFSKRFGARKFIAYFQAYTGTYTTPDRLRALFDEALCVEDVVGLDVATRPDCLPGDVIELLCEYRGKTNFWLELGLQTANDEVLKRVNRGHDVASFISATQRMKALGFQICAHMILGLPGDDWEHMMQGAKLISELGIDAVKLHHLHILKTAPMEGPWRKGLIPVLELQDYASWVVDFLERIPASVIVQRLAGSAAKERLLAPMWTLEKAKIIQTIENEFKKRESYQGKLHECTIDIHGVCRNTFYPF
ncbi:MAG: TIGR01212 family radical SAM protein [Chlamydiae bacterium]|nr:TIGR01212 family radical SAM protein [Chlamydiota bacterium]MBI3266874.1 TIGR01212 family radical SAM protein [Chlamydiota bacterium]